jgi:hypothetical protein
MKQETKQVANKEHVKAISERYAAFERFLLQNGMTLSKDTGVGFWGVTHIKDLHEVFKRIKLHEHNHLLDLGSGDGRVVLLASLFGIKATGIEVDDWLVNTSLDIKRKLKIPHFNNVTIRHDNFMGTDIADYDIIYVSPDKPFFRGLEQKLKRELKGKLIVHSYEFHPKTLEKENEWNINGERFAVYKR